MKFNVYWHLQDDGKEIIEAESKEEAIEKFRNIPLAELVGTSDNIAEVSMVYLALVL